jgi:hypothetical protein
MSLLSRPPTFDSNGRQTRSLSLFHVPQRSFSPQRRNLLLISFWPCLHLMLFSHGSYKEENWTQETIPNDAGWRAYILSLNRYTGIPLCSSVATMSRPTSVKIFRNLSSVRITEFPVRSNISRPAGSTLRFFLTIHPPGCTLSLILRRQSTSWASVSCHRHHWF